MLLLSNSLHFQEFNNSQAAKNDKIEPYVAGRTSLSICKDSKGNLSWYQVNKDGKIYMRNHLENNKPITKNNDYPDLAHTNQWKPIKNTYGSNINAWWHTKIDDYDKIDEEDRPSSMKRLGRVLIGQDNMTGECLCGHGCLRCCGSGYNEEPFYNTENLSDKLNILNEQ